MTLEWIVQLEMARGDEDELHHDFYDKLVHELIDASPGLLYCFERYALAVSVHAQTALEAHSLALSLWEEAVRRIAAPEWVVVRAEVTTAEEFEREFLLAEENDTQLLASAAARGRPTTTAEALVDEVFEDPSTRLPTAAAFRARVHQVLTRRPHPRRRHAILVLDLELPAVSPEVRRDPEEVVVLQAVERLGTANRRSDAIARIGPTALALLLEDIPDEHLPCEVAERTLRALQGAPTPSSGGTTLVSAGIAVSRAETDADRLFSAALAAAQAAKRAGGGRWALFHSDLSSDLSFTEASPDIERRGLLADE